MKDLGLFPLPSAELLDGLAALQRSLARAYPLKTKHKAVLPVNPDILAIASCLFA